MRFLLGCLALATLVLLSGGCQEQQIIGGRTAPSVYRRVVSLSPSTTEVMATYSDLNGIIGRTESCNYPPTLGRVPIATKGTKPDYEVLAQLRPDLILMDVSLYGDADIQKVKSTSGATVSLLWADKDGKPLDSHSIDAFIDWLYRFGAVQADPMRVSKYADSIFQARASSLGEPLNPKPKVAVLIGGENGESFMVAGTRSFQDDVVRAAGGEPVGPDSNRFEMANIEGLVQLNPDAILTTSNPESLFKDARLQSIQAIRSKRVAKINEDVLLRSGARIDKLITAVHGFLAGSEKGGQ